MAVCITTDIFCDICRIQWVNGATGIKIKSVEARQVAKLNGWKKRKGDGIIKDICPACAKKGK